MRRSRLDTTVHTAGDLQENRMIRVIAAAIVASALAFSVTACGGNSPSSDYAGGPVACRTY